jgi:hypothetical protein
MNEKEYLEFIKQWKEENKELIKSGKCRKTFLECLPRKYGVGGNKNKLVIDWINSIGYNVYFIYENIIGWIEIISYKKDKRILKVKYNKFESEINTNQMSNCNIGRIIGKITSEFKIEIGQTFKDNKRDITVTDKEIRIRYKKDGSLCNDKWYKYTCNVCSWNEGWMTEGDLLRKEKRGCSCCSGKTLIEGINDVATISPCIVKYFQDGYDEAKKYTKWGSGNPDNPKGYIYPICPDCGRVKKKKTNIGYIYKSHSIGCSCSDNISKGEKYVFSLLEQIGIKFITQLSKREQSWCNNYRYDFYFQLGNKENYIIEVNGQQHYEENTNFEMNLDEQVENDKNKKELALKNDTKEENYIIIDYRKADLNLLRKNILNDKILNELFDLSKINWIKCYEFALSNLVKKACELKKQNPKMTTTEIGKLMGGYCRLSIQKWLESGNELGWCHYNKNEEINQNYKNSVIRNKKNYSKPVEIFKDGISLGLFPSASELERQSIELFKVKLIRSNITLVCQEKQKHHKGYEFNYLTQEEYDRRKNEENLKQAI